MTNSIWTNPISINILISYHVTWTVEVVPVYFDPTVNAFISFYDEIPNGHESLSLISSNVIANMFGLGSAATPFGLKAMKSLQELNSNKKVASKSMITFLVLNTSGLTIIPTTIISLRMMHGSNNPTEIVLACLIATIMSTTGGLIINKILASRDKNVW